jgi:seryl-tRNA synthetase
LLTAAFIRENPDLVVKSTRSRGEEIDIGIILGQDEKRRELLKTLIDLRAKRNLASEKIGELKREGLTAENPISEMRAVSRSIKQLETDLGKIDAELYSLLIAIPNLPHESVPIGLSENDNQFVRDWGSPSQFDFQPLNHVEIGTRLKLFDFHAGSKISGSGFPVYTGKGAKLERSLINYMLDFHVERFGYTEIFPPFLAREETLITTGQLPKLEEDMYRSNRDDLFLIPTAEVPVTNIHREEILNESDLPINYVAYSACFRREAGSYGKDTRGLLRLHQFNKVELVKFVTPESSYQEHEALTKQAEAVLQSLNLHYRVINLCTGDLSFAAAKCYDLEVWAPGEAKWLEVSSCSNYEGFQAQRGNIRYRRQKDKKVNFVHTLNGSGLATPRLLVALLETYQTADGHVRIPKALIPYVRKEIL